MESPNPLLNHQKDSGPQKPPTAPPSGIHGIPAEKLSGGLNGAEQQHGALWFKGNFAATQFHTFIIACSLALTHNYKYPIHSNRYIQTITKTREQSGVTQQCKRQLQLLKDRNTSASNFSEHLKLTRTMIAQHMMALFWGVCLMTLGWMTYAEASVPENLDKSIDELKAYYVSRPVWISIICHITVRKRVQKLIGIDKGVLFQDMACKILKDGPQTFLERLALQTSQLLLHLGG